jgi:serine/threonine protein phosphatase PrpC
VLRANAKLLRAAGQLGPNASIGSTVAAVLIHGTHYACAWSGDSRVYLVRGGHIRQLSRDHRHVQDLVDSGAITPAEARVSPQRSLITRAVGIMDDPGLEVLEGDLESGDAFVVCSDGLTDPVEDAEILQHVEAHAPQAACDALIDLALERGGPDNVTVIVVRCLAGEAG